MVGVQGCEGHLCRLSSVTVHPDIVSLRSVLDDCRVKVFVGLVVNVWTVVFPVYIEVPSLCPGRPCLDHGGL